MVRALAVLLVLARVARADELDDARKLEGALEYEKALAEVEAGIALGHDDAIQLASLELEAGKLAAGLDRAIDAERHFARALELDPTLTLPAGTSPKLTAPFYAARSRVRPLAIARSRVGARLRVTVQADPAEVVHAVRVHYIAAQGAIDLVGNRGPRYDFAVPPDAEDVHVTVVDEHGNTLYDQIDTSVKPDVPSQPHPARMWFVLAGAAAAVGAVSFWRLEAAQEEWSSLYDDPTPHDYSTLRAVQSRGEDWATAANVSFGVAGALALVGSIVYLRSGDASFVVAATPSSLGVVGRF